MIRNKHLIALIAALLLANTLFCQFTIKGKVMDKNTGKSVPFASVFISGTHRGTNADINGKFSISSDSAIKSLTFSFLGYFDKTVKISKNNQNLVVKMKPNAMALAAVTIHPGVNPAIRIIEKAIENRKINNPEKHTDFQYTAYNKFYITGKSDSSQNKSDTISPIGVYVEMDKPDSFFKAQNLFMMESITKRKHIKPDKDNIDVIASRVSGFKNPSFTMLATEFQSFSIYSTFIDVGGESYLSPISSNSYKKYHFILRDTLFQGKDTVFIMSFKPFKGKNFNGLKGRISINTNGFAVENIVAQPNVPSSGMNVKIVQNYKFIDNKQWFPTQLNTVIIFNDIATDSPLKLMGVNHSYIQDIDVIDPVSKKAIKYVDVEINPKATKRSASFWKKYRGDSLNEKELKTYHVIDSVGKKYHFDRKLRFFRALTTGKIPLGPVSLDLNRVLRFNDYENVRLGLGFHTNEKVSRFFSIGGYGGYGFSDKAFKYGGDLTLSPQSAVDLKINLSYQQDLLERGGVSFYNTQGLISTDAYRNLYINRMDSLQQYGFLISFRPLKFLKFYGFYNKQNIRTTEGYRFLEENNNKLTPTNQFDIFQYGAALRYAYGEKFFKTTFGTVSTSSKYPVVWLKYTHAVQGWDGADYFDKIDLQIDAKKQWRSLGTTSVRLLAGYVDKALPATFLFDARGTGIHYSLEAPMTFETMNPDRFMSNEYADIFFQHNFKELLINSKHFAPQFRIMTNIGFGSLSHKNYHEGISFETMEKGYYESGLAIDNLLKTGFTGIGVSGFYLYGPYSFPHFKDNLFVKFTITYNL